MGLRFRRSIRLLPGLRLNLGKTGASLSIGGRGATVNLSPRGTRTTVGLPGTGLSYSTFQRRASPNVESPPEEEVGHQMVSPPDSPPGLFRSLGRLIGAFIQLVWAVFVLLVRVGVLLALVALVCAAVWQVYRSGTSAHQ